MRLHQVHQVLLEDQHRDRRQHQQQHPRAGVARHVREHDHHAAEDERGRTAEQEGERQRRAGERGAQIRLAGREVGVGLRHSERRELRGQVGDRGQERDVAAADRAERPCRDQHAHERQQRHRQVGPVGGGGRARERGPLHQRSLPLPVLRHVGHSVEGNRDRRTATLATSMLPGAGGRLQRCGVSARRRFPVRPGVVRGLHVQARALRGPPHPCRPSGPGARALPLPGARRRGLRGAAPLRQALPALDRRRRDGALGAPLLEAARRRGRGLAARAAPAGGGVRDRRGAAPAARRARRAPGLSEPHAHPPSGAPRHPVRRASPGGRMARSGPDLPACGGRARSCPSLSRG